MPIPTWWSPTRPTWSSPWRSWSIASRTPTSLGRDLAATLITRSRRFAASIGEYLDANRAAVVIRSTPWSLNGILTDLYAAVADAGGGHLGGDKSPNDLKFLRILLTGEAGFG
jgi:hypothetical protein